MNDDSSNGDLVGLWLTRAEAARYVGVSGESAIRAAEAKGLEVVSDANGQFWHTPETLDAWTWRSKPPTAKQKARVLREALKARRQEARERQRKEEAEAQREEAEWDAQFKRYEAEDALRETVRKKAEERRAAFELTHMDQRTAGQALGSKSYEARGRLRDFVNCGLLRRVESPYEPRVEVSYGGTASEVESIWPLCSGGPFYLREDVMALRNDVTLFANEKLLDAPPQVREAAQVTPSEDIVAELLRVLMKSQ